MEPKGSTLSGAPAAERSAEMLAPVPSAADHSVSADLWNRLEAEIEAVSVRIDAGEKLVPDDITNVRKLKSEVDSYVTGFNKAMRDAMDNYKKMVARRLADLGFDRIEQFVAMKRAEQSRDQDARIAVKMDALKMLSDGLIARTTKLKDMSVASELLPAFVARFPKVQSGAKGNDITDWKPYFSVMYHTVMVMDTFFNDPVYADAGLLPIYSGTIRELLAYARDGKQEHLEAVRTKYGQDAELIRIEKLRRSLTSKEDGIFHIRHILNSMGDMGALDSSTREMAIGRVWSEITDIVRLVNNR